MTTLPINEATIENQAIATLQQLVWHYRHGQELPEGWHESPRQVILQPLLREALQRLNPQLPDSAIEQVLAVVMRADKQALAQRNRDFYELLKKGVPVSYNQNGEEKHERARLLDFRQPANNHFLAINQLEILGNRGKRIPDLLLFINGLPLVIFELKNPLNINADLERAFNQLQTYQDDIVDLFVFNQIQVISDGTSARIGSLTANFERFSPWQVVDEANGRVRLPFADELTAILQGLFPPAVLLDYLENFILFAEDERGQTVKKIAAYHQFYGVNAALRATLQAAAEHSRKIGVVWHTQGSGKSLSMLFYAARLLAQPPLKNPTVIVITDRNDLDGQLFATFSSGRALIGQEPVQAEDRETLRRELAKRESGGVIFSTIQKFGLRDGEMNHPVLNERSNIIVISDEAHRSQYGFNQSINERGETRFGYAKHLRDALPNASFIGFTGTPIALEDKDTREVFGKYLSIYDIRDAVEDGATVPIIYEARQIGLQQSADFREAMASAEALLEDEDSQSFRLREKLLGSEDRLRALAADMVNHFETRNNLAPGKAMVVVMSRRICVALYDEIIKLRPHWHSDDVDKGQLKIVMTGSASDPATLQRHIYSSKDKEVLAQRFKNPNDPLQMVIVRDMWLTGFDAPCCHTMYIDKPMQGHNLMQAIARVNRVFKNKSRDNGGLIVDYVGLAEELRQATQQYTNAGGKSEVKTDIDAVFIKMQEHIDIIRGQLASPVDGRTFDLNATLTISEPTALLTAIRQAASHVLGLDRVAPQRDQSDPTPRKNAFLQAVRLAKKGFSLCGAYPAATPYRAELAFYDAVRATIIKASGGDSRGTAREKQLQLMALINRAIKSDGVVDLFALLRQEQPNIAILSDNFLDYVKNSDSPDLWVSSLESYLRSHIRTKTARNLTQKKFFTTKLQEAMNRYHNHNLSVLDIINELLTLAKELQREGERGREKGLNEEELAFYDALARNASAEALLGDGALINLAREITELLRRSVSVDWHNKRAVRAELRLKVRRALKKYKYPPDQEENAINFVLRQAENLAEAIAPLPQ